MNRKQRRMEKKAAVPAVRQVPVRMGNAAAAIGAAPSTNLARWSNPDSLLSSWDGRARLAAQFVPDGACVLDIGCGKMALERELPANCRYIPADLVARDARTILCELNSGQYPREAAEADLITLLGVVEYVTDLPALFRWLRSTGKPAIVTYHPTDMGGPLNREGLGWLNHLSIQGWSELVVSEGLQVDNVEKVSDIQLLFRLSPHRDRAPRGKRVRVLSYLNNGNFGDRLGYHLLPSILPADAEVAFSHFTSLDAADFRDVDLLVLGIGNSLFAPLLTDELQRVVEAVPHTVGIFGTQYRNAIDRGRLGAILGRLSTWYARSEEDILLYGNHARNVVHLGDWLIDAFPMARPDTDEVLVIGTEVYKNLPLDRTIQLIQRHRKVVSARLHPLLCALTSADQVQYAEQRKAASGEASGKFRSMLMDVFGRTYPEDVAWTVDREKVAAYKRKVSGGIDRIRAEVGRLLAS